MESQQKAAECEGSKNTSRSCSLILRLVAVAATLSAAIVMGLDKETKTISVTVAPTLPPLSIEVTAKSRYSSAFVYFVVANAIACFFSVILLVLAMASKGKKRGCLALLISGADTVVLALLFSSNGAAAAIGMVGERGISKVGWNKVCNVYTKYCAHVMASIAVSFVACLVYLLLVLLALVGLHRKSPTV